MQRQIKSENGSESWFWRLYENLKSRDNSVRVNPDSWLWTTSGKSTCPHGLEAVIIGNYPNICCHVTKWTKIDQQSTEETLGNNKGRYWSMKHLSSVAIDQSSHWWYHLVPSLHLGNFSFWRETFLCEGILPNRGKRHFHFHSHLLVFLPNIGRFPFLKVLCLFKSKPNGGSL